MTFEFVNIIHVLIVWLSLMFFFVLLTPKYIKKRSNKFLAFTLLTIGVHFIYNLLYTNNKLLDILPAYSCSFGLLYGPLLYFYVKFSLHKKTFFKKIDWLHFSPVLIVIALTVLNYTVCNIVSGWVIAIMLVYCGFSFCETIKYRRLINQISSQNSGSEIQWINLLVFTMLVIILLNGLQMRVYRINFFGYYILTEILVQIGVLVLVTITIYQGLKNPSSFQLLTKEDLKIIKSNIKVDDINIHTKENAEIVEKLNRLMAKDKPFIEPDLTLNGLSEKIGTLPITLSQTIKHHFNTNFSDYINSLRIEEAKSKLEEFTDNEISIKEIMFDCGFNSRSVFNTVFKRKTGLTPSQYRKYVKK